MDKPSLFQRIKEAGIPYTNHQSDLYFKSTPESEKILKEFADDWTEFFELRYAISHSAPLFINGKDGTLWRDAAFAYDPWWEARGMK